MKNLQEYLYESNNSVEVFLKSNYKGKFNITENDGKIEVSSTGKVEVKNKRIESLTNGEFVFSTVKGFSCDGCSELKTLEGAPHTVKETFSCEECESLESLIGGPTSAKKFYCSDCENLKSLEGAPEEVVDHFGCERTGISNLEGCSKIKKGGLNATNCQNLVSLKGCPVELEYLQLGGCSNLKTLEDGPKKINGNFECWDCGIKFKKPDIKEYIDVRGSIWN